MTDPNTFIAAAAQAAPVFLDRKATLEKACDLITEAGRQGAKLIVFPEAFLPAYPDWCWMVPGIRGDLLDELYAELVENSVSVPDETTVKLCQTARRSKINVVMGINERNIEASNASLYNSILYISDSGTILGRHRKLIPTAAERTVWSQGNGSTLECHATSVGMLGGLICWENYMPLARYAMYERGVQVYAAPTWDYGNVWSATLQHIAKEGGVFVIGCCMPLHINDIPERYEFKSFYPKDTQWINPGGSCIIAPDGNIIAGPVNEKEDILFAEIDLKQIIASKRSLDVAGHYARPDVFHFSVDQGSEPFAEIRGAE
jgi:nitrilase